MSVAWSEWQDLTAVNIEKVPPSAVWGVYMNRLVDEDGEPVQLRRDLGVDSEAIFYIGASGVLSTSGPQLQKRLTKHRCAHANGKRGGADDEDLNVLWKKITSRYGHGARLQFRYVIVGSAAEAQLMEGQLH